MGLLKPDQPEFDLEEWRRQPYAERLRLMCVTWCTQGFGAPDVVYVFYLVKILCYVGGFFVFAWLTPGLGGPTSFGSWWSDPLAFQKAVIWTMTYEVMGFGCGSGPLTGHYRPIFPVLRHWLRPGTVRLRPFAWVPFTAGHRRSWFDVALYAAVLVLSFRALLSGFAPWGWDLAPAVPATLGTSALAPVVVALCVLGLRDKTIFLACRAEHYLMTVVVFLFAPTPLALIAGAKSVQLIMWIGAAVSKLTHNFPNVMAIMQSNSPVMRSKKVRRALYRKFPEDLRPSRLTFVLAHTATFFEFAFPLALAFTSSGPLHTAALVAMVLFHLGIFSALPMGVPLEWNVMFIYSGLVLFGAYGDVQFWSVGSPVVAALLVALVLVGPVWGSLRPDKISFLVSMRYYAGNWAPTVWLFRRGTMERLDEHITKASPVPRVQLEGQIEEGTYDVTMARGFAMRAMHLHGPALATLLPATYADLAESDAEVAEHGIDAFELIDGEQVAGMVLGWNFGDGHLHHEDLLAAVQAECGFAPGELRCLFLESQPLHRQHMHWRIADAATGRLDEGYVQIADLRQLQPWGAPSPA